MIQVLALFSLVAATASAAAPAHATAAPASWRPRTPTFVVFSRSQAGGQNHDLYIARADGTHQLRLTASPGDEETPQFSPDGRMIVFRAAADPGAAPDIWVMRRDGSHKQNLTRTPKATEWSPTWTPDGRHIVFSCAPAAATGIGNDLCIIDRNGTHRRYLFKNPNGSEEYPSFDPSGRRFAYIYYDDRSQFQVWTATLNGTQRHNISGTTTSATWPAWSPDAQKIAFKRPASGGDIWIMRPDGTHKRNLTNTPTFDDQFPAWLPDGRISFTRGDGMHESSYVLWVMNADGTDQHKLIPNVSGWANWTAVS